MDEINVTNIPQNRAYEYDEDHYILKTMKTETNDGNYSGDEIELTEVYSRDGIGNIHCDWSGRLVTNPSVYGPDGLDEHNRFTIFSYDLDCDASFMQTQSLEFKPDVTEEIVDMNNKYKSR